MERDKTELVAQQAAEWLVRAHAGDLSVGARREYMSWLKASPLHVAELLQVSGIHTRLMESRISPLAPATDAKDESNVVELTLRERTRVGRKAFFGGIVGIAAVISCGVGSFDIVWGVFHLLDRPRASLWG
jgi:transmembrane sensor